MKQLPGLVLILATLNFIYQVYHYFAVFPHFTTDDSIYLTLSVTVLSVAIYWRMVSRSPE